jgi:hypothetical protein
MTATAVDCAKMLRRTIKKSRQPMFDATIVANQQQACRNWCTQVWRGGYVLEAV